MSMIDDFREWITSDEEIADYWKKVEKGANSYRNAEKYSQIIGKKVSELLENGYEIDEIRPILEKAYKESAYYSKSVLSNINKRYGINLKVLEPRIDDSRIDNFIDKLETEDATYLLEPYEIENITRSAVTDTIDYNAREESEAGIYTYITRDTNGKCCDWCESLSGTYIKGQEPKDFWKVHTNCSCSFEYRPSKSKLTHIRYGNNRQKITT